MSCRTGYYIVYGLKFCKTREKPLNKWIFCIPIIIWTNLLTYNICFEQPPSDFPTKLAITSKSHQFVFSKRASRLLDILVRTTFVVVWRKLLLDHVLTLSNSSQTRMLRWTYEANYLCSYKHYEFHQKKLFWTTKFPDHDIGLIENRKDVWGYSSRKH